MAVQDSGDRPEAAGPDTADDFVSGRVVAKFYKVNPATVRKWRLNGQIPYVPKPGGNRYLYPRWLVEAGAKRRDWWENLQQQEAQDG